MDTRTYQEVQQPYKPFDWLAFFKMDEYDQDDLDAASTASGSWVTCACGNQCVAIPRDSAGVPVDQELRALGFDFHNAIYDWWVELLESGTSKELTAYYKPKALELLQAVEWRAAQLLEQLNPKEDL